MTELPVNSQATRTFACVIGEEESRVVDGDVVTTAQFYVKCEDCGEKSATEDIVRHTERGYCDWHKTLLYVDFMRNHRCGENNLNAEGT